MAAVVPAGWAARVNGSHNLRMRVQPLINAQPVGDWLDVVDSSQGATASTVTVDTTNSQLWTTTFTIPDPTNVLYNLLVPGSTEVAVTLGVDDGNGGWWDLPAGIYAVTGREKVDTTVSNDIGPLLTFTGQDRSQTLSASPTIDAFQVLDGTSLAAATARLIRQQLPWLPATCIQLNDYGVTLPAQIVDADSDVWSDTFADWWGNVGLRLWLDRNGVFCSTDPTLTPPIPVRAWAPGDGLLGVPQDQTDITALRGNGITVTSSNPSIPPCSATAWDNNPASDTWVGLIGYRLAGNQTVDTARTPEDCFRAAALALETVCLTAQSWQLDALPDPSVDPYDQVSVTDRNTGGTSLRQTSGWVITADQTAQMQTTTIPVALPSPSGAAA